VIVTTQLNIKRYGRFWLVVSVLSLAEIYLTVMTTGLLGQLNLYTVATVPLLLLVAAVYHTRSHGGGFQDSRTRMRESVDRLVATVAASRLLQVVTGVCLLLASWLVLVAVLVPPVNWDSLAYHLPAVVQWIQFEHIFAPPVGIAYYPKNVELYFLWVGIFLRDSTLFNISQLPFVPLGMLAVYTIARESGRSRESGVLAALVFFFTPTLVIQSVTNYIDVAFASLTLTLFALCYIYFEESRLTYVVVLGIVGGLIAGAKFTGGPVAGIGLVAVCLTVAQQTRWREYVTHLGIVPGLFVVFGGYWYLRNWAMYGNPLHPIAITVAGVTVFPGGGFTVSGLQASNWDGSMIEPIHGSFAETTVLSRAYYSWFERIQIYGHAAPIGGLGPLWPILGLPSIALFTYFTSIDKNKRYLLLIGLFLAPLLFIPLYHTRFILYIAGFGAIAIVFVFEKMRVSSQQLLSICLVGLVVITAILSSGFLPWKYQSYVDESFSNPGDATTMSVRGSLAPLDAETYETHIPPGSKIGYVRGDTKAMAYALYDRQFYSRVVKLRDVRSASELQTRIETDRIDYLVLATGTDQSQWATNSPGISVRQTNSNFVLLEVQHD
jgi:4-amino-4-deoxy-L-arabinose transferase-like glycosyltransferase